MMKMKDGVYVGQRRPRNCSFCMNGTNPPSGQLICGTCEHSLRLRLQSQKWQAERRVYLTENPYCWRCLEIQLGVRPISTQLSGSDLIVVLSRKALELELQHVFTDHFNSYLGYPTESTPETITIRMPKIRIRAKASEVLDHVKPWRTHPTLFDEPTNWQPLDSMHHNEKTINEDGGLGHKRIVKS